MKKDPMIITQDGIPSPYYPFEPGKSTCANCVAFHAKNGECRRHAPDNEYPGRLWPRTDDHDWCLEWIYREK